MNNSIKFLVKEKEVGKRLDVFLSEKIDHLTRSNIKKIIESSNVTINKKTSNFPSKKIKIRDKIEINFVVKNSKKLSPSDIKLDIFFEDEDLII